MNDDEYDDDNGDDNGDDDGDDHDDDDDDDDDNDNDDDDDDNDDDDDDGDDLPRVTSTPEARTHNLTPLGSPRGFVLAGGSPGRPPWPIYCSTNNLVSAGPYYRPGHEGSDPQVALPACRAPYPGVLQTRPWLRRLANRNSTSGENPTQDPSLQVERRMPWH